MGSGNTGSGLIGILVLAGAAIGLPLAALAAECREDRLEVRGPSGIAQFSVELADSPEERAEGLMFREKMASSAGMLFVYEEPQHARFWMKNTLIALDMIFADATGTVTRVLANAIPQDETAIDGGADVAVVLEINGGRAAQLGIVPGSVLRHPALDPARAVWPCTAQ